MNMKKEETSEKLRIAMIGHKRIPGREGGVEVVVEELATRMAEKGHAVTVFNRRKKGIMHRKEYQGVKIVTVPTIEKKSLDAVIYSFFASIYALFRKYDVIHYHAIGPSFMLIIPHFFRKRTVVTVHGLNYKTPKWNGFGAKYMRMGEWIAAKFADEIITLSREQQNYFKEKYGRETVYVPNGTTVHPIQEAKEITERWGLHKEEYILFLSRIVPGKGLETLINAYKQIKTDKKLIVAGESVYVNDFQQEILKNASTDERIRFVGFVEGNILQELYSNTALFVFPSEAEGMPMCLLEAMSYNTKCLVSDIPENIEVGKHYVETFKVGNENDLKEKLEKCINESQSIFSSDSRMYIESNYNWNRVVDETLRIYRRKK